MKTHHILYMLCICLSTSWMSCEKADQTQTQSSTQTVQLSPRTVLTECSECPIGCCCCGIEGVSPSTGFTVQICGLCEGDYHCGPYMASSPCSNFSGLGKHITFYPGHFKEIFCVEPGATIRLYNPSPNATIYFRFSCTYDQTGTSFTNVSLMPTEEKYFHSDGECIVEGPC